MKFATTLGILCLVLAGSVPGQDEEIARKKAALEKELRALGDRRAAGEQEFEAAMATTRTELARLVDERQKIEAHPEEGRGDHAARIEDLRQREAVTRQRLEDLERKRAAFHAELVARHQELRAAMASLGEGERRPTRPAGGKRITLSADGESVGRIIRFLATEGGVGFVYPEGGLDAERKVTVLLRDVPAVEAAMIVLEATGHRFDRSPSGIVVILGNDPKREAAELEAHGHLLRLTVEILELERARQKLESKLADEDDEDDEDGED